MPPYRADSIAIYYLSTSAERLKNYCKWSYRPIFLHEKYPVALLDRIKNFFEVIINFHLSSKSMGLLFVRIGGTLIKLLMEVGLIFARKLPGCTPKQF
jgi:hypothetical protein